MNELIMTRGPARARDPSEMITARASAYPRIIDFERMRAIADSVNSFLFVDMAHIAGLVAGGQHPSSGDARGF